MAAPDTRFPRAVLLSDVDGTLMDEDERLVIGPPDVEAFEREVELVLTSSRTIAELLEIQERLALSAPMIAENGALIAFPPGWRGSRAGMRRRIAGVELRVIALGDRAGQLRPVVRRLAARAGVDLVEQRDLLPDNGRAIARTHSILVRESDDADRQSRFRELLAARGLEATRSGRWLAITRGANKGTAARALLALAARRGAPYAVTAAVGNHENDLPLLAVADQPFVIRNPRRGHDPALAALPRAHLLQADGITGWPDALSRVLARVRDA
ncbi:MAG TPA: HAD hydrolase family protein [Gemmatimonadaceae bacterium]